MDYRNFLNKDLEKFSSILPEYTLCQQVFAIMQTTYPNGWTKEDLLTTTDEQLYSNCIPSIKREKE